MLMLPCGTAPDCDRCKYTASGVRKAVPGSGLGTFGSQAGVGDRLLTNGPRESMVLFGRESHGSLPPEKRPGMTIVAVRRFPRNLAFPNRIWIPPAPIFAVLGKKIPPSFLEVLISFDHGSIPRYDGSIDSTSDRFSPISALSLRFLRSEAARIRRVSFSILEVSSLLLGCVGVSVFGRFQAGSKDSLNSDMT